MVRVWFDSTINPLLRALEFEIKQVEAHRLGWKSSRPRLDNVAHIDQYLEFEIRDNFYQICEYFEHIKNSTAEHDKAADSLLDACQTTHRKLAERWENWAAPVWSKITLSDSRAAGLELSADRKTLLIELVINRTGQLDDNVGIHPIWNAGRDQFLDGARKSLMPSRIGGPLLALPEIDESSERLRIAATKLHRELHELRRKLAAEHDEPYATKS